MKRIWLITSCRDESWTAPYLQASTYQSKEQLKKRQPNYKRFSTMGTNFLTLNKICKGFICKTSWPNTQNSKRDVSIGLKSHGLWVIWTGTKIKRITVWMILSTSVPPNPSFYLLTSTVPLSACILIKTFNRLISWEELSLGSQTLRLWNVARNVASSRLTSWCRGFYCIKIPENSLTPSNFKMISIFTTQLQMCMFGYFIRDWEISLRINLHFNWEKSWSTLLTKWSVRRWKMSKFWGNSRKLKISRTIYMRSDVI